MRALLLDLDGTLIHDRGRPLDPADVELMPGAAEGLRRFRDRGFLLVVVTNQAAIGRGDDSIERFEESMDAVRSALGREGIDLAATLVCTDAAASPRRKPNTGMWDELRESYPGLDALNSVMVGDKDSDVAFGRGVGCVTARIHPSAYPMRVPADHVVRDLSELADAVLPRPGTGRVLAIDDVAAAVALERARGRTIVTTNGAFDLFHAGHRYLLERCRALGDVVVVGVNGDAAVRAAKGRARPVEPQGVRARKVADHADLVFVFDEPDPRGWLRLIRPHVHANAESYGTDCIEADVVREVGARLALVPVRADLGSTTATLVAHRHARLSRWRKVLTTAAAPLLIVLSLLRRTEDRVLVVRMGGLGDAIAITPLLRAIRTARPGAEVHVFGGKGSASLLERNPHVDRVYEAGSISRRELMRTLRRQRYRAAVNVMPRLLTSSVALWSLIPVRISASPARGDQLSFFLRLFSTKVVPYRVGMNTFDHAMRLAACLGVPPTDRRLDFPVGAGAAPRVAAWMAERNLRDGGFVVVQPSAGNAVKEWPPWKWVELSDRVVDVLGLDVVVATLDTGRAAYIRANARAPERVVEACGLELEDLAVLSARAACFVSVDAGPLYVAAAAGARLVVIVGVVRPEEQIPNAGPAVVHVPPPSGYEPIVSVLATPSFATDEERCAITETSVDAVFDAVRDLVARDDAFASERADQPADAG